MAEIAMRKVLAGSVGRGSYCLVPVDQMGAEDFGKIKAEADVFVQARTSLNMAKWRLFQALAVMVANAHPKCDDREDALTLICYGVRHVHTTYDPKTGKAIISRASTSPYGMSGEKFDRLFDRAMGYVLRELLPEIPASTLRDEIEKIVAPNIGGHR